LIIKQGNLAETEVGVMATLTFAGDVLPDNVDIQDMAVGTGKYFWIAVQSYSSGADMVVIIEVTK